MGGAKIDGRCNRGSHSHAYRKTKDCLLPVPFADVLQNRKFKTIWFCLLEQRLARATLVNQHSNDCGDLNALGEGASIESPQRSTQKFHLLLQPDLYILRASHHFAPTYEYRSD